MDSESTNLSPQPSAKASDVEDSVPAVSGQKNNHSELASVPSASGTSSWALKIQQSLGEAVKESQSGIAGMSALTRFTRGFGSQTPSVDSPPDKDVKANTESQQSGVFESFTKGLVDSSRSAVKAMQVKARHIVSQNKRRYQDGGFDLDMTYITENIIAMGFPAGSITSGLFGYLEGFYRNHMEEVINFFETHHKGKYKVYNLCSERLYDASLFEGKVASFPFDDHNCPKIQLIKSFCQSAYSWLKEDIQNVVVVHCKAGMARTGLMICSLLLFLKFFPTAEEAIDYYNQKRCVDGKALTLPSQIRYVKYFERILTDFKGENQPGRRCMLRGFRIHKCPYWIRPSITISDHNGILFSTRKHPKTKDLMPEDFWMKASRKGIVVFALPGEPGLTELAGDFKIHFHERQGDFYCWLNTTMTENRKILDASELDGFDKRKLPSPGFQVEIVMIDYDGTLPTRSKADSAGSKSDSSSTSYAPGSSAGVESNSNRKQVPQNEDNDDVFSDSDGEEKGAAKSQAARTTSGAEHVPASTTTSEQIGNLSRETSRLSLGSEKRPHVNVLQEATTDEARKTDSCHEALPKIDSDGVNDIKSIAADASVFTFGDDEDFESD
ncbi:Atypical dual specificity phosphatase, subfamily A [Trema orientale]|uniref:Atypical dual specificity phosphatase, subfamily A n=1 Tax=Trema orientale TaxID=63057 RepID=A0A2P5D1N2_TREOI|nr:Atypical dual specificity phosphatase, subfamily A [Trema orientale]